MNWVQIFTGGPYRDWSIAVEPMTCGPDAFNEGPTHDGLIVLGPGESYTGRWGITRQVVSCRTREAEDCRLVTQSQHQMSHRAGRGSSSLRP